MRASLEFRIVAYEAFSLRNAKDDGTSVILNEMKDTVKFWSDRNARSDEKFTFRATSYF